MGNPAIMAGAALLGGVLLWEVTLRSQMGISISFLEEIWSRNLGHVFVSPLRPYEMIAALICMSIIRMPLGVMPAILLAWALYAFNLFALGPVLLLFFVNLMIMGWSVALGVVSLILRHGAGAEALAWGVTFGLAPFSAVFYPVAVAAARAPAGGAGAANQPRVRGHARHPARWCRSLGPSGRGVRLESAVARRRRPAVRVAVPPGPRPRRVGERRRMTQTNFWLIRHALVEENARAFLYGVMDVPLCETTLIEQAPMYQSLAARLPRPAVWLVTPLTRTRRTAETIFAHGYPAYEPAIEPRADRAVAG